MSRSMIDHVQVPAQLKAGTLMLKVSAKKTIKTNVSLEYERGQIVWETKKGGSLNIESVREIRFGQDASYYRTQFKLSPELEGRWLTIIYLSKKSTYKMLHLIACDPDTFALWKETLLRILAFRRELLGGLNHMRKRQDYWLKQNWSQGDSTEDAKLDFQEIVNLCRKLNISVPQSDIQAHFDIADSQKRGYLDFPAFQHFVKLMKRRPDLESLFQQFTSGRAVMSVDEFTRFMQNVQHSELTPSTIHAIYTKFLDDDNDDDREREARELNPTKQMTIEGFASFLQSADNAALHEKHTAVHQDMSLPLHDYFISTSHNTYLVGNQLKGESTVEGYIRALQHGCRSVELDCWDGDAGEPVIYHGRTLTRKLQLSEALKAISKHAFVASPYPLILSLEVHCQPAQQERLAELLKTCLGEALVDRPLENLSSESLPSPKDLMYRILVKAKKPIVGGDGPRSTEIYSNFDSSATSTTSGSSTSSDSDLKRRISNASTVLGERFKRIASAMSIPSPPVERSLPTTTDQSPTLTGQSGSAALIPGPSVGSLAPPPSKIPTAPLTNSLSSLIVYTVGVKARGFNKLTTYEKEHILSLSERTVNKFLKAGPLRMLDLIQHNRSHLTRAYPAATRVFSSNFLPHRFWAVGLQLVACNWQTHDLAMELNSAFFDQNGRSGYLLKPLALRVKGKEKDAATKMHKYQLDITIISIQQLPKLTIEDDNAGIDPCVEVQLISPVPNSSCTSPPQSTKRRTKVVKGNGFNPVYHEEFKIQFQTPGEMVDLCFLRLLVIDAGQGSGNGAKEEDGLVGKVCVCLGGLQPGYRHLPLHDDSGQQLLFASIFINSSLSKLP
ncbi:Phospholipase C [Puccinia graminis f. sp. tritici]|uniref:Phosphoinositide phospholipase C n=3 Tax=Puccinia graminis f. sp. tritici TaxID=56615 RepID=E3KSB3_PUCGT|nr:uncharacterized protein PGTG_13407 [Puccinia graminis f. sp. tritici CRL 75-36-700-3]EFP87188.2 hypothetical protein PGTG_13407 [Puccinia graminis f. sp. tritici CRL 75-36-700-3]KAA1073346.1 Phospholipase C [Puccinia graminis f. sp. tritici]